MNARCFEFTEKYKMLQGECLAPVCAIDPEQIPFFLAGFEVRSVEHGNVCGTETIKITAVNEKKGQEYTRYIMIDIAPALEEGGAMRVTAGYSNDVHDFVSPW